jgi:hypothetical protein
MTDTRPANLMDHLQEQGYEPEIAGAVGQYDLIVSGIGSVRVCVYPDDGYRTDVYAFDGCQCTEWHARFSPGTPDAAIIAVVEEAEWRLAAKRGGVVTPAQAEVIPRKRLQQLLDAIHREPTWADPDGVSELLQQFFDIEGFDLLMPPVENK